MPVILENCRRLTTQFAIRLALSASAVLPIGLQRTIIHSMVMHAVRIPILRRRILVNMQAALGQEFPTETIRLYFHHVAWFLSNAFSTFNAGIMATPVPYEVKFDESVRILDAAISEGRGAILVSPHWSGHELFAAMLNRRHPVVMLVRQGSTAERMRRKLKWYKAIGADVALRPAAASTIKDAVAYLKVLKSGKILAITPDLLGNWSEGVEVRLFGRLTRLHGGAFALAVIAKAPIIRASVRWESDNSIYCVFERAPMEFGVTKREVAIRTALQDWCDWFESQLKLAPENWLFWLDKRWSRFLREVPRVTCAQ